MLKKKYNDDFDADQPASRTGDTIKKKGIALAEKLRTQGKLTESQVRQTVDDYRRKLIDEARRGNPAPEGLTRKEIAQRNLESSHTGETPYDMPDNPTRPIVYDDKRLAAIALERAVNGEPQIETAEDLAAEMNRPADSDHMPKGLSKIQRARIVLDRACKGLPPLIEDGDDEK